MSVHGNMTVIVDDGRISLGSSTEQQYDLMAVMKTVIAMMSTTGESTTLAVMRRLEHLRNS